MNSMKFVDEGAPVINYEQEIPVLRGIAFASDWANGSPAEYYTWYRRAVDVRMNLQVYERFDNSHLNDQLEAMLKRIWWSQRCAILKVFIKEIKRRTNHEFLFSAQPNRLSQQRQWQRHQFKNETKSENSQDTNCPTAPLNCSRNVCNFFLV